MMPARAATVYAFGEFTLTFDPHAATVVTTYPDGTWSGGAVVREDAHHAARLGLAPLEHRLHHELAHHVVAIARRATLGGGCPIIWRSAHGHPQGPEAATDEWVITAFQYAAAWKELPTPEHYGALIDLRRSGVRIGALAERFRWLLDARAHAATVAVHAQGWGWG